MAVPACLTCISTIEATETVPICDHDSLQSALSKYFWFDEEESTKGVLCQSCWHKIDDFHKFYCEIELLHSHRQQHPIQLLEVKQEENHDTVFVEALQEDPHMDVDEEVKSEIEDRKEDEGSGDDDDDEDYVGAPDKDEASDDDSQPDDVDNPDFEEPKASRSKVPRKKYGELSKDEKTKIDKFISTNINMQCDTCSEKHSSFKDVQRHSRKAHKKRAFLFCCGRRFCNWTRLLDHVQVHLDPDLFACTKCSKKCPSNEALASHMSIKHSTDEEKTFQCDICPKKFSRLGLLTMHRRRHPLEEDVRRSTRKDPDYKEEDCSDEEEEKISKSQPRASRAANHWQKLMKEDELISKNIHLECDTCQKQAKTYQELQEHSQKEHKRRADVSCCGRKFIRKSRLIEHVHFHLNPSQFKCELCSKQFHNSQGLVTHMDKKHSTEEAKAFKCSECPKSFSQKFLLSNHERYHRRIKHKPFQCKQCDKSFAFESVLQHHIRSAHTKEYDFVCHICAKGFHAVTYYNIHMETKHEDAISTPKRDKVPEERIQCSECGLSVAKRDLKKHMLRHTGTQRCDQCGQECKNIMALRWHKRQHNKPDLVCSVCEKVFKKAVSLKEHMTTHTGEVLYSCDFCDKTFNSHANRAAHRKKMHPKEWFEDKLRKNPNMQLQMEQHVLNQL